MITKTKQKKKQTNCKASQISHSVNTNRTQRLQSMLRIETFMFMGRLYINHVDI